MTAQRRLIYDILKTRGGHLTAQEIYETAKIAMPSIALGTVYRNLSLMASEKEIGRLPLENRSERFEAHATPHDHLICDICGAIRDVLIPGLGDAIEYQTGVKVSSYRLTVRCVCAECRKNSVGGANNRDRQ